MKVSAFCTRMTLMATPSHVSKSTISGCLAAITKLSGKTGSIILSSRIHQSARWQPQHMRHAPVLASGNSQDIDACRQQIYELQNTYDSYLHLSVNPLSHTPDDYRHFDGH